MDTREQEKTPNFMSVDGLPEGNVLPITFWPSASLEETSDNVPDHVWGDENHMAVLHRLIADMVTTMYATGGMGLSAPQVGIGFRIFVCDTSALGNPAKLLVAVNPEIEKVDGDMVRMHEGCLSFPGVSESIERPARIRLRARDKDGARYAVTLEGMFARVVQHEYDHLDGILMLDRMGELAKRYVVQKMRKLRKSIARDEIRVKEKTGEEGG